MLVGIRVYLNEWENRFEFSLQSIYGMFGWTATPCWISSSVSTTVCFGSILKVFAGMDRWILQTMVRHFVTQTGTSR